ncbi:hypothetical protein [Burkholderia sp. Ac-20353]|uniref:hypothetical protein n=1 Tax=Burkholderia sp. Ac-20353 TaxID=2703894 RepID=UPI001F11B683|nr:hypothetical protein [Burkholderia sp. Ac-20353]
MESMVKENAHRHLEGLNRFRNYLLATQWDLGRRELVGRKLSAAEYLAVKPDVIGYHERIRLLRYLLALDALEVERAERHAGDLASGRLTFRVLIVEAPCFPLDRHAARCALGSRRAAVRTPLRLTEPAPMPTMVSRNFRRGVARLARQARSRRVFTRLVR